jgi:hypothetical protein
LTSLSKHFMMTEVSATERWSLSSVTFAFLGTGTMVTNLKHVGTADWDRERLNMPVNAPASWSAHALRTRSGMPSGPAALRGLTRLNVLLTSATEKVSPQSFMFCQHKNLKPFATVCLMNMTHYMTLPPGRSGKKTNISSIVNNSESQIKPQQPPSP